MKDFIVLFLFLGLLSCGDRFESTTINRIQDNDKLDEYDMENLSEMFYSQCKSVYSNIKKDNKYKANKIDKCVADRMKVFEDKYGE
jgi:hypothetical protein